MKERNRPPTHPGGILKRQYLETLNLGVAEVAEALKVSRKTLYARLHRHGLALEDEAL